MLTIKMMSGENLPDTDTRKSFRIFTADNFEFLHEVYGAHPALNIYKDGDNRYYPITGNCYVMENGKTIASFSAMPITDEESMV